MKTPLLIGLALALWTAHTSAESLRAPSNWFNFCAEVFGGKVDMQKNALKVKTPSKSLQFANIFKETKPVIGMLHLYGRGNEDVVVRALQEMLIYQANGVKAVIVENYHGTLEQVALVLRAIQGKFPDMVIGVNVLPNEYQIAFPLAAKYGAKFIQLDFVAGKYLRSDGKHVELNEFEYAHYRAKYPEILVLGGVHPKYYQPAEHSDIVTDLKAGAARADAIVVTGAGTGKETPTKKIQFFRSVLGPDYPLVVGAGLDLGNAGTQMQIADGAIVGSYFKSGVTTDLVNGQLVQSLVAVAKGKTAPLAEPGLLWDLKFNDLQKNQIITSPTGGSYQVIEHGKWVGKRGYVIRSIDQVSKKTVAVKMARNKDVETLASFEKEAEKLLALSLLTNRIPETIELGSNYNVKNWVEGPNPEVWLKEWVEKGFPRKAPEFLDLIDLILEAAQKVGYIGDLNRKNLVWNGERWIIIDNGSIKKLSERDALEEYASKLPEKWAKYLSSNVKEKFHKRLREALGLKD